MYMYIYVYTYIYVCKYIYMYICTSIHIHIPMYTYIHASIHTDISSNYMYVYTYTHTHKHTHTHIRTHTHTHTHTPTHLFHLIFEQHHLSVGNRDFFFQKTVILCVLLPVALKLIFALGRLRCHLAGAHLKLPDSCCSVLQCVAVCCRVL